MAPLSSPYKVGAQALNRRSASPLPPVPQPPPKAIGLNSSTRSTDQASGSKITRRAFICDVVVENEGEDTANMLSHLGRPLVPPSTLPSVTANLNRPLTPSRDLSDDEDGGGPSRAWSPKKREEAARRLHSLVEELVRTERSYLMRIKALKASYADPLRSFAKDKHTQIIPLYEAKNLFANIDQVVPASQSFLADLEDMWESGRGVDYVGDICLKHLKDLGTFAPYRTYLSKQDEVQKLFQDALKKYSGFSSFIDSTKYQTTGIGNIGLRELLMEPVQRIPRYTLLWQTMIKAMSPMAPQRSKLMEAIDIASRIAKCEPDAQIVRATVMYCLQRNVEDFPADLFSNKRDYLDSLDVDDIPMDFMSPSNSHNSRPMSSFSTTSASTPSLASIGSSNSSSHLPTSPAGYNQASLSTLHCTLFLFNDKLIIVKRQSAAVSGRKVTGLDDVARLVKSGGGVAVMDKGGAKKDKLSYRGIVDVLDVIASDVGNGDFHLFFERPPTDQTDRWSARPFRSYSTVHPPYSSNLDSVAIRKDKLRFIHNLWAAQTVARAKLLPKEIEPPRPMVAEYEVGLEGAGEVFGRAKCYWSVWDKKGWNVVGKRAKVVLHIDEAGSADDLALSEEHGPFMLIRLQPLSGGLCRISYATIADEGEDREVISMADAMDKIATIIHRYGIFKFRTSNASAPNTPSSTSRLRPSMLNLDAISRNLFGAAPSIRSQGSSVDAFGTATSSKRSNKGLSRSTTDASRISSSSAEDRKRLSRMSTSSASDKEVEEDEALDQPVAMPQRSPYKAPGMGASEIDLNERLELARNNSKSMAALSPRNSRRMATRSQGDMRRTTSEEPPVGMSTADTILANLPLSNDHALTISTTSMTSTTVSTTAPLRVRNKTPSPTRPFNISSALPQLPQIPTTSPFVVRRVPVKADASGLGYTTSPPTMDHPTMPSHTTSTTPTPLSPRGGLVGPRSPTITGPRSPLMNSFTAGPSGARSPLLQGPRPLPSAPAGSAHTRLRVVSGNGRRVSAGRETVPLKDTATPERPDTTSPVDQPTPKGTPTMLAKRQHSEDHLTPRKRSLTRSPLEPIPTANELAEMPEPPRVPSSLGKKPRSPLPGSSIGLGHAPRSGARTPSGNRTPRRGSGQHLTPTMGTVRRASAASLAGSTNSHGTAGSEDVEMADHTDIVAALDAGVKRVTESKAASKRLRVDIVALKKQMAARDGGRDARGLGGGGTQGSMPRSPQRRNMNRLLDMEALSDYGAPLAQPSRHATSIAAAKHDLDSTVAEERLRGMVAVAERLEGGLKAAIGDLEVGRKLVGGLMAGIEQKSGELEAARAQVVRAKDQQELLRQQLGDAQIEVDTIYEAFNTELDGMFYDAQLPPTEAFMTLQQDLRSTKSERNDLRLENTRLRRELEESNLKREQWSKMLRQHGFDV